MRSQIKETYVLQESLKASEAFVLSSIEDLRGDKTFEILSSENNVSKTMWSYHKDVYEALKDSHAAIIMTKWDIYKTIDWKKIKSKTRQPFWVFDTRLVIDTKGFKDLGINLWQLGYGNNK